MKQKKMLKGLIGVVCVLISFCLLMQFSYAYETDGNGYCKKDDKEFNFDFYKGLFGIIEDTSNYTIVRQCGDDYSDVRDIPLYVSGKSNVSSISGDEHDGKTWLSCSGHFDLSTLIVSPSSDGDVTISLSTNEGTEVKAYSKDPNSCKLLNPSFEVSFENTSPSYHRVPVPTPNYEAYVGGQHIDCDTNTVLVNAITGERVPITNPSFEYSFCESKKRAISEGNSYDGDEVKSKKNTFKCDYTQVVTSEEQKEGEDYFTNLHSTYAVKVTESNPQKYVYHYSPNHVKEVSATCKITCQEAVDVQYGPPVVSRAGMCFEYTVRVTSRVSCGMTTPPPVPDPVPEGYCTPNPVCSHGSGTYEQGGPNDDFDACIKNCDGGKYSKKCSNKCYQQVYGSISASAKVNSTYFDSLSASKLKSSSVIFGNQLDYSNGANLCQGYYDNQNGIIKWIGTSNGGKTPGRWYCENNYRWTRHTERSCGGYGVYEKDGFFRQTKDSGYCHDGCSWNNCRGDVYLNPSYTVNGKTYSIEKDQKANEAVYQSLIDECSAKATCSTTEATFTISADVNRSGSKVTYDFPYSTKKDTITHFNNDIVASTQNNKDTTLLPDYPKQYNGLWGCYRDRSLLPGDLGTGTDRYRSTWSFPTTWMNAKTGEISYTSQCSIYTDDNCSWAPQENLFCIPGDASNVNVKYWSVYRLKEASQLGYDFSTFDGKYDRICHYSSTPRSYRVAGMTAVDESDITWNIHAKTTKFGYFDWNFNIDCFYAINDDPLCGDTCCEKGTCETPSTIKKECTVDDEPRIRPTDLEDMFPDVDGAATDSETTGRIPGYNWSGYAINNKNGSYKSNPVEYMKNLQRTAREAKSSGTAIYSTDNLDYEFILSPSTLRKMRKDGGSNNYAAFDDNGFLFNKDTGIIRYRSAKIRDLGKDNKIPDGNQIYCNNMINWNTTKCDDVHE